MQRIQLCKKEEKRNIREAINQCNGKSNKRPNFQNNSTTSKPLEEEVEEEEAEAKEMDPHPTPSSSSAKSVARGDGESSGVSVDSRRRIGAGVYAS